MKAALISAWHATQAAVDAAWQDIEAEETRANVDAFRVALKQARIAAWRLADYLEKTVPRTPKQARDLVPAPAAPPSAPAFPIVIVDEAPGIPPPASYEGYAVPSSGGRSYVMTHEATLDDCVRALCVARERSPDGVVLLQRHTDAKLGAGRPQIWWFAYGSLADLTNDLDNPGMRTSFARIDTSTRPAPQKER